MKILLVRHAHAIEEARTDEERWLTPKGRAAARSIVAKLEELKIKPTKIFTSPLVRAVQTAEFLALIDGFDGVVEVRSAMAPDRATATAQAALLDECDSRDTVMLVGHEPSISALAGHLLSVKRFPSFRKGAVCLIRRKDGDNEFEWLLSPKTLQVIDNIADLEP